MTTRSTRDILINLLGRETVSPAFDKAGRAADKFGDQLDDTADDARRLDREIEAAEGSLRDLARQYARTQDAADRLDLTRAMRKQQTEVRRLTKVRGLLPDNVGAQMGAQLASDVGVSFVGRLGPVMARMPMAGLNPAVAAIGAPLVAGLVTLVGAGLGSAIVGGVGLGGVAGGLAVAARDPAVKAAAGDLADEVGGVLERSAAPMVPAALRALAELRTEAKRSEPEMTRLFAGAARLVPIVTDGLADTWRNILPGLTDAVENAGPAVHSLMRGISGIGKAIGDGLSDLSQYADEGGRALSVLLTLVEGGVHTLFAFLKVTSELYSQGEILGAFLSGDLAKGFALIADREANAAERAQRLSEGLDGVGDSAGGAARESAKLLDVLQALNGVQLDVNASERAFQAAIDDARKAFQGKSRDFAGGTERGREYGEALDRIATSAKTSAQAIYDQTQSTSAATAKINEGREALYNQARAYGRTDAEARAYVNSVLSIPKQWETRLDANTAAAIKKVRTYKAWLEKVNLDKTSTIYQRLVREQHTARGGHREFSLSRGGYIDAAGPKGVDSVPAVLAPGEGVLTAAEVDRLGGKDGFDRLRQVIASGGRSAAGGAAAGGGGMAAAATPQQVHVVLELRAPRGSLEAELIRMLRREVRLIGGGNVQLTLGY
ncbi:hypothetical protein [Verrucosispora sp. WMMD1129]|uniref:hypothetical protein n=1 Tax=Verrucosispora sp. WMMD1129 TaxID=3016093 RepID=UPI00249BC7A9|nr:hypothetical protein [Verrucosispora sp. WMMD1129]WFE44265.1 hypothetical protein O7624_07915 [Verrucosispora sp. WMMD1129]